MELACRFPELDDVFYALLAYDREQYFEKYEDGRSLGISVLAIGIIIVGLCVQQVSALSGVSAFVFDSSFCLTDRAKERLGPSFI